MMDKIVEFWFLMLAIIGLLVIAYFVLNHLYDKWHGYSWKTTDKEIMRRGERKWF